MTKPWTESLTESEVRLMNEIIAQVPTDHGARDAVVSILQNLADGGMPPKFRFLIVSNHTVDVTGTNDKDLADDHATDEDQYVIDLQSFQWIQADLDRMDIPEVRP